MKTQIKNLFLILLLVSQIDTLAYTSQFIIHIDSGLAKVCVLPDKSVLVLSSIRGLQKTKESKFDEKGNVISGNSTLDFGYTRSSQLVQPNSDGNPLIIGHNKQTYSGQSPLENITQFSHGSIIKETNLKRGIYQQKSTIALKSGKVFNAGIEEPSADGAATNIDLSIFDPKTNKIGNGLTLNDATSKYISCIELTENNVYCFYVSHEHDYVSKLRIRHIKIDDSTMTLIASDNENKRVIKTFYTKFNFLKAVPFNEKEAVILFQTGNNKNPPKYGNTGQDLYFYHLEIIEDSVHAKRYEYLSDQCIYREDPEEYNADIAVLSENRIYVACETNSGKLRGFFINPAEDDFVEFNFNYFDAAYVKNPVFAKFDKTLGIFYTHVNQNDNSKVAFHLMNYPDCVDFNGEPIILPKNRARSFDFDGKVFINNAYPADRQDEEIYIRFNSFSNLTFTNDSDVLVANKDYDPKTLYTTVKNSGLTGIYSVEYEATRNDPLDGLIIGRTCKINFNTPKCLPQCDSCTKTGDEISHKCLGCANNTYYKEDDPYMEVTDFGNTTNCPRCNISCASCYGGFRFKPRQTTNCIKCDYNNGYYHLEEDESVCISYETQDNWEDYLNRSIYLDDTPGKDHKEEWRWKYCHKNCKKCHGPGTDEDNQCDKCIDDYYFYCNQTIGHGIPGSCHNDCVDNGFFLKNDTADGMKKCCPCIEGCRKCPNEYLCDDCFPPFFRNPDNRSCVNECGYCLAEDIENRECVNCKTRYSKPMYKLNKTCVDESKLPITLPDPYWIGRKHHVVDETCNDLIGCKEGCFKCKNWYTEHCTECWENYFKEDFFSLIPNETFRCFTERECQGVDRYKFDLSLDVGGVPKILDGEGVCYNCRLRENNYRQVENNFTCGPRARRTYIDYPYYNKLSQCYTRCASCNRRGDSCYHNCLSCRDPQIYGLVLYDPPYGTEGNCIRYTHKCKGLPYYHDYDLAEKLGINEDSCGEDCDVCLLNNTCTENYPYFVVATRECVELCPLNEVLSKTCLMEHPNAGYILLQNPFELQHMFTINRSVNISNSIFRKIIQLYNISLSSTEEKIINNVGTGQVFNLPKSEIIIGNNISIELTSVALELEKLASKFRDVLNPSSETTKKTEPQTTDNKNNTNETSIIDLSECQEILKKKYQLPEDEILYIFKGDTFKLLTEDYYGPQVDYQLFSYSLGAFLPLNDCKEKEATVTVTNPFVISNVFSTSFQSKMGSVIGNGYDGLDSNSPFYRDICTPFTNEYGTDVLLEDRIADYFNEHINVCEKGCVFVNYSVSNNLYTCKCNIKDSVGEGEDNKNLVSKELPEDFYKKHKNSNIEVIKCASQVFSSKGQNKNFGSYVLLVCLAGFIACTIFYFLKGPSKMKEVFNNLEGNIIPASPPGPKNQESASKQDMGKKPEKVEKDFVINEEQLNYADFDIAKKYDTRSYFKIYWSLLKMKQLFIFTFYTYNDYNLRIVKIALFILFISFYFAFTALFFNDSIMRQIYKYRGNTDAAVHIPNIILSSLSCLIMNFIVRFVSLNERDISKINCERNENNKRDLCRKTKKILKIKLLILFAVSIILIGFFWYYVAAFCAVFKNSQGHYFINVLVAFIVCNIWPCVTSLIPPILRRNGIKNDSSCMYKASQIIAYI